MDIATIIENLKELTLDLAAGKRQRSETVMELNRRIEPDMVYKMDEKEPQRDFITQVYVSLDNLTTEEFAPSPAEIKYFAECFEGKRKFNISEVRNFEIGSFEKEGLPKEPKKAKIPNSTRNPSDHKPNPRTNLYRRDQKA